jgi:hypothetical protein
MIHTPPNDVESPVPLVKNIRVIYDGGVNRETCFSVAELDWDGDRCLAIRWNVSHKEWDVPVKASDQVVCRGMPTSHGVPIWFVLPDEFRECVLARAREL